MRGEIFCKLRFTIWVPYNLIEKIHGVWVIWGELGDAVSCVRCLGSLAGFLW